LLLDVIENQRKSEHALSVWDRSVSHVNPEARDYETNLNVNHFVREPGHIEYAASLGLGVYDRDKIKVKKIDL
jgi:hypothetical protein